MFPTRSFQWYTQPYSTFVSFPTNYFIHRLSPVSPISWNLPHCIVMIAFWCRFCCQTKILLYSMCSLTILYANKRAFRQSQTLSTYICYLEIHTGLDVRMLCKYRDFSHMLFAGCAGMFCKSLKSTLTMLSHHVLFANLPRRIYIISLKQWRSLCVWVRVCVLYILN